jgi:hypothetical protein
VSPPERRRPPEWRARVTIEPSLTTTSNKNTSQAVIEAATRTRAVARILSYEVVGRIEVSPAMRQEIARLPARASWWADKATSGIGEAA